MKTLEEIIEKNIKHLKKTKEMSMSKGHEAMANETQIIINVLLGILSEHKNQVEELIADVTSNMKDRLMIDTAKMCLRAGYKFALNQKQIR